jgi:hypothetical protein
MQERVWAKLEVSIFVFTSSLPKRCAGSKQYLVHHADDEALLLNLVGLDGVLIFENLACGPSQ